MEKFKFSSVNFYKTDGYADIFTGFDDEESTPCVTIHQGNEKVFLTSEDIQRINYEFEIMEYEEFIDEMWNEEDAGFSLTEEQKRDIAKEMLDYVENNGTEYETEELLDLFGQIRSEREEGEEEI